MKVLLCTLWLAAFLLSHLCAGGEPIDINRSLLDAVKEVESGGDSCAIGDKNLQNQAYGLYQIRKPYYDDAVQFNPSLSQEGSFPGDVWGAGSEAYSEKVIGSYMGRYATENRLGRQPTDEDIARIHNGGPNGYMKDSTLPYWEKVQQAMNRMNRQKRDVANCTLTCNQNQCCGSTSCNCLDPSFMVVPCDSLSGARQDILNIYWLVALIMLFSVFV